MGKKFAASLSEVYYCLCIAIAEVGIPTLSQAVKAMERRGDAHVALWKAQLSEKRKEQQS